MATAAGGIHPTDMHSCSLGFQFADEFVCYEFFINTQSIQEIVKLGFYTHFASNYLASNYLASNYLAGNYLVSKYLTKAM